MTVDLEHRLRTTLTSAEAIVDGSYVVEPVRSHRGLGRVTGAMVAVVALLAGGYAWKTHNEGPVTIHFAEGNWTTPADNVLAIDWDSRPFDAELGVPSGLGDAMAHYMQGCPRGFGFKREVLLGPEGRSLTQREAAAKYGSFMTTDPRPHRLLDVQPCAPHLPVPDDVLQLSRDRAAMAELTRISTQFQLETTACVEQHPELKTKRFENTINANGDAVFNGTYEGLPELQELERQIALGVYRCQAEPYLRRRAAEKPIVDAYLAVPENRARLERVKVILKELGLSLAPPA